MITDVTINKSTHVGGVKTVHFSMTNDGTPCDAHWQCKIQGEVIPGNVQVSANETVQQSCRHHQSGMLVVEVKETDSGESDSLLLDLEAAESRP